MHIYGAWKILIISLPRNRLCTFMIKRTLVFFTILLVFGLLFLKEGIFFSAGLIIGQVCGLLKFILLESILTSMVSKTKEKHSFVFRTLAVKHAIELIILIFIFIISIKTNIWFFAGETAGVLLIPVVIIVNSLTESFRLSKNNFESSK